MPVPSQFSESLIPVSTACPVIESTCQGSAAPLVPVLPCKLVLLAAGGGGGGVLSDDYFYLRSHRGQDLFARHRETLPGMRRKPSVRHGGTSQYFLQ